MLPKHAVILLSDPEKLRRSAEDLAKTANEFLAASWHVAASGHGAGAPISFDEASFLDYAETISSLEYSEHPVIRLTSFGVDTTLTGHVQLDAQNPAEFRGDEAKASQGIEGLLDAGFHVTITAAAAGTLARLKRAINTTGIANFDVIRSQAIDGFVDKAAKIALLTERDLTGRTSAVAVAKTPKRRRKAIDLVELKKGDYVVHEQHGIGRFIEMRQRIIGTGANKTTREYLVIEYAPSKARRPGGQTVHPHRPARPGQQIHRRRSPQAQQARRLRLGGHQGQGPQARPRDRRRPDQAVLRPPARQGLRVQPGHPMAERAGRRLPLSGNRRPAHHHRRS